MFTTDLATVV